MFKFVVLSVLLAVAHADVDKFLGKAFAIAISPYIKEYGLDCNSYTVSKVSGAQCTCAEGIIVPLLSFKFESGKVTEEFYAGEEVKTVAEAEEVVKVEKCKCGDKEYPVVAFKEINDNYHVVYSAPATPNGPSIAILSVKTLPTQANLDETVDGIPDLKSRTDYKVFCGLN